MSRRRVALAVLVAVVVTYLSASVDAECILTSVRWRKQHAAFVFDGTVIKVDRIGLTHESVAAIEVHRVWKGKVEKNTAVYSNARSMGQLSKLAHGWCSSFQGKATARQRALQSGIAGLVHANRLCPPAASQPSKSSVVPASRPNE